MSKKLQVFISSTYTDLIEERQAAVEAILLAQHLPAGMELFKSGDVSQKEIIKRWIDESDVYMLILGGRYGSIDQESKKSYTHWEYEYAEKAGKPRFAVIISDEALKKKVKEFGQEVIETDNTTKYKKFKEQVLTKISKRFEDTKDIKLAILESMKEFEKNPELTGWVSGSLVSDSDSTLKGLQSLLAENTELKNEKEQLLKEVSRLKQENLSESLIQKESLINRVDKVLKVMNIEEHDSYDYENEFHIVNDRLHTSSIIMHQESVKFRFYKEYHDGIEGAVSQFWFIGIVEEDETIYEYLSEIRIMIEQQKYNLEAEEGVKVKFILVVNDSNEELNEKVKYFSTKVCDLIEINEQNSFEIEVWDEKTVEEYEFNLVLRV